MSLTSLEYQVSELVNSDTCPRPAHDTRAVGMETPRAAACLVHYLLL
jgi:hypothetical protein